MWRDTMRPIRVFVIDARVLLAFLIILPLPYWPVFLASSLTVVFFAACAIKGLSVADALRRIRVLLAGNRVAFRPDRRRRLYDYDQVHGVGRWWAWALIITAGLTLSAIPREATAAFVYIPPPAPAPIVQSNCAAGGPIKLFPPATDNCGPIKVKKQGGTAQPRKDKRLAAITAAARKAAMRKRIAQLRTYRIKAGETLIETLRRWGARDGIRVVALTDRDWTLPFDRIITGVSFDGAVRHLASILRPGGLAPVLRFAKEGKILIVTHEAVSGDYNEGGAG